MPETFERGREAGKTAQRLDSAEARLTAINGALVDVAAELKNVGLVLQGLSDRLDAAADTRIATADALEKANVARRESEENNWSPFSKTLAVIGALGVLAGILYKVFGL